MSKEFIIGLTEHRTFGQVFHAFMIEKQTSFYSVIKLVKSRDIVSLKLNPVQAELVNLTEQYSDEKIVATFSKNKESSLFFHNLTQQFFDQQISPYIDKYMNQIIRILMKSSIRLFHKQTKYGNLYDEDEIFVSHHFTDCLFSFTRTAQGTYYQLSLSNEGKTIPLLHRNINVLTNEPGALLWHQQLYPLATLSSKRILPFLEKEKIFIPAAVEKKYYQTFVSNTIRDYQVKAEGFIIESTNVTPSAWLDLEIGWNSEPILRLCFQYGTMTYFNDTENQSVILSELDHEPYRFFKIDRKTEWEQEIDEFLKTQKLIVRSGSYQPLETEDLQGEDLLYSVLYWLQTHREILQKTGISIRQKQKSKQYTFDKQAISLEVKNEGDWFDIYSTVKFGDYEIPFIRLKKYILNGIREFKLPNGKYAILPKEWFKDYADLLPFASIEGEKMRFQKHHFQLINNRLKGLDTQFLDQFEQLEKEQQQKVDLPEHIQAKLRTYQIEGYSWMYQLQKARFGACLADDMGLGKTLQTLCLLLKLKRPKNQLNLSEQEKPDLFSTQNTLPNKGIQPASLIILPTSLLHNWQNEIQRFTPSLKVYQHFGIRRKNTKNLQALIDYYDIILTSYGTVRNDIALLRNYNFFYIILDESQNIKNPGSKIYQAIMQLKSIHRLAITGTPIENSLSDLWAQINFINKGLLGNFAFFKRQFLIPIERKNDEEIQEKLKKIISPFILRRTKEQVAKDLPERTEQIRYCGMSHNQQKIYEEEKSAIRNNILENIEKSGVSKSTFLALQGLTRLRLLANHPILLDKENDSSSGKFEEITQSLQNIINEQHKVLVFSSFVSHLHLLEDYIREKGWNYSILTGQSTGREKIITDFQTNSDNRIFLISLKAGGVGLNLTSADYVFIIDPWWNPAAENQAINRAHRIGQNKKVFVYRFITEDSIEEKIQSLQQKKSNLADKFVNAQTPFKQINKKELIELFN